jgi:hypothetical protein
VDQADVLSPVLNGSPGFDEDNNVYEDDADIGDVHDELENLTAEVTKLDSRLESAITIACLIGGAIILILLAQTIHHW